MNTEWGPDVYDSELESEEPMVFEKYARVPKEFSAERKSKDTRLIVNPFWAWQGYMVDDNGLTEAGFDNNDFQVVESYDYNTMDEIRSEYGTARNVFTKLVGFGPKRNVEHAYVDALLNMAKAGMTPEELHIGAIEKAAEDYLDKGFERYLKKKNMECTEKMSSIMHDIAKQISIFDYIFERDRFNIMKSRVFAQASQTLTPIVS